MDDNTPGDIRQKADRLLPFTALAQQSREVPGSLLPSPLPRIFIPPNRRREEAYFLDQKKVAEAVQAVIAMLYGVDRSARADRTAAKATLTLLLGWVVIAVPTKKRHAVMRCPNYRLLTNRQTR